MDSIDDYIEEENYLMLRQIRNQRQRCMLSIGSPHRSSPPPNNVVGDEWTNDLSDKGVEIENRTYQTNKDYYTLTPNETLSSEALSPTSQNPQQAKSPSVNATEHQNTKDNEDTSEWLEDQSNENMAWDTHDIQTSPWYEVDTSHKDSGREKNDKDDFLHDLNHGTLTLRSEQINIVSSMGSQPRIGNLTKDELDMIRDIGHSTPLEAYAIGQKSLYDNYNQGTLCLLPKTRCLVLAESGMRSSCLYESLLEWLDVKDGSTQIRSLSEYYKQWFLTNGNDFINKKLTHTHSSHHDNAALLRKDINEHIANNAQKIFDSYRDLLVGEGYTDWKHLQQQSSEDATNNRMGGTAQLIMFSHLYQAPIIVWEHLNDTELKMRYMECAVLQALKPKPNNPNPTQSIVHLLYSPGQTDYVAHYDAVVVFDLMQ